ncbi:hypothetical protein Pcinc_038308 [Petrolisthes cinctipes]|uniref:DUSP domain-containing protein n=1 Tax=Petrolisthes cinctipes TaxID=88211 RepID=A0AAE1BUQ1_PETCI|nr:hypothetical protein Pcinc_038308 [Petrolisthes cinctipes]
MSRQKEYGPKDYMTQYIVPSEEEWDKYKSWILAWLDKKVTIGDRWFFVELAWVKRYVEWLKSDRKKPEPGPVEVNTETRQDLLTKEDLMSHKPLVYIIWEHISQRFTVRGDRLPIRRNTVYGPNKESVVEDTLERIYLVHHSNLNELIPYGTSRLDRFCSGGGYPVESELLAVSPHLSQYKKNHAA